MKHFRWNHQKNAELKDERDISFEQIVLAIEEDGLLDTITHQNIERYPNQSVFVVLFEGYVYLVPFVEEVEFYFLKTVIPSRKATRDYLQGVNNMRKIKLDDYEKEILDAYDKGEMKSAITSKSELEKYRSAARETFIKDRRVNIRLSTPDLMDIQERAIEEGIPYQTLIASVLHKYVCGRLVEIPSRLTTRSISRAKKLRAD